MKWLFICISFPLFSQSVFENTIRSIYIDNNNISDISSFKDGDVAPIIYLNIPNFSELTVTEKKLNFIYFLLPAILLEKEKIKKAYNYVVNHLEDTNVNDTIQSLYNYCNCTSSHELLLCLKEQPNSIILAQAAVESGWGTSRFLLEGNNLFGIHTYNNDVSKLKANNSSLVYVKKYNTISESISHYLRTLAKGYAYENYRINRFKDVSPIELIHELKIYSERRELYIKDLESIIEYNNLTLYDNFELIDD